MTQRQIDRAHRRSLKTRYSHLSKIQYRFIKLHEREQQLEKAITGIWRDITNIQPPPYLPDNTSETVLKKLDWILDWQKEAEKVRARKERMVEKHGIDEDRLLHMHMLSNIGPGGSF